jgi:hypothetical protein
MTPIFDALADIAHRYLDIPTLEKRRSDSLDFHEVSVWSVKDALWAAYQAGVNTSAASTGDRDGSLMQKMLTALQMASNYMADDLDEGDATEMRVFGVIRSAIAEATANARVEAPSSSQLVLPPVLEALERAEFLMRRVHDGDHQALRNLPSASKQARTALARAKRSASASNSAPLVPVIAVNVQGGLINDMNSTSPVDVVVEDWDVSDEDTGKKPTRSVWKLVDGLSPKRAVMLRRLIAND